MIKTFTSESLSELDKMVNEFMTARKRNLPVRTEVYILGNTVVQKATVFYDEVFSSPKKEDSEIVIEQEFGEEEMLEQSRKDEFEESKQKTTNKIGALWWQKDNRTLSGKLNEKNVVMPENVAKALNDLEQDEPYNITIHGEKITIWTNKFKKTKTHPDYVMMKRKEF